jgi:xylulokinase
MYLLGIDIGSSFVKASIIDGATGQCKATASSPAREMIIHSIHGGWAEQDPEMWWKNAVQAIRQACAASSIPSEAIKAIGISYQMHGLVLLDRNNTVLRPSIIWCDSRAVETGKKAFESIGKNTCLGTMLNSPGNFTASKLKWVKDNEPDIFRQVNKCCLPGDYIALRLTGRITTTVSGLSEGILWDFSRHQPAQVLLDYYGIPETLLPEIVPTFGNQGGLTAQAAKELGFATGTPVTYRAGDQPNNAFSLNVLEPGEVAATAGTSGVMYGVTDIIKVDTVSRVNTFAHVNHSKETKRLGVLLCINGTGIANAWTRRLLGEPVSYDEMNALAESIPIGCDGLIVLPFGNGAERMIENRDIGALVSGLSFNRHSRPHLCRAVQEGIAFALNYGIDIMRSIGVKPTRIRAGRANMFLSKIFRDTLAGIINVPIELYNTDGAQGAARGAGVGAGIYRDLKGAFAGLALEETVEPAATTRQAYVSAYQQWLKVLEQQLKQSN